MQTMGSTSKDIKEKDKRLIEGVIQKKKKQKKVPGKPKRLKALHKKILCQNRCGQKAE